MLFTAISAAQPTDARIPEVLSCKIIGEAGCSKGICVGNASGYQGISLRIQAVERKLVLNGIEGRIRGDEPLEYGQKRLISWRPPLLAEQIHIKIVTGFNDSPGKPVTVVELMSDRTLVEFRCEAA